VKYVDDVHIYLLYVYNTSGVVRAYEESLRNQNENTIRISQVPGLRCNW